MRRCRAGEGQQLRKKCVLTPYGPIGEILAEANCLSVSKTSVLSFRRGTHEPMVCSHNKTTIMKIYLKKLLLGQVIQIFTLVCWALSPTALAVTPALDGGHPKQNTAEDD